MNNRAPISGFDKPSRANRAPGLRRAHRPRLQMSIGPVVTVFGLALFTRISYSGNYLTEVLPAVVAFGLGLAITVA
jgi:hypothetical protein